MATARAVDPTGYRDRLVVQKRSTGKDAAGQPADEWVDVGKRWGLVRWTSGGESVTGDAVSAGTVVNVLMRSDPTIDTGMRLKLLPSGRTFEITAILAETTGDGKIVCQAIERE